ncbi:MAG: 2Fe-2S iron-sulfur cluster binding domain-containing protein [Desulfobacterales bacterium]|jgi:predicted molibdopterin-dependent oxidoreductase YjgC|nr:2Fe-2S iron-sulfur cluster binding domain-containing protein [Desulfobacteraceae bacterium]MBT7085015.1 2Fe-2S iron-sulfur cluster binding domain-containing protein [Desulfobacterales bacterium]MBT7698495.1 2Fe-2S iron-sulfur cluster binding domain-containing protein [Desulfobacterales bacterium]
MNITIDGQVVKVTPFDNNIIDIADRTKIVIPSVCYREKNSKGCCQACIVEIDGEQKFACATKPVAGMNVVVDRKDLKIIRRQRLLEYRKKIKNSISCE